MKFRIFLLLSIISNITFAQDSYWQQHVTYEIDATLNDKNKSVIGLPLILYGSTFGQMLIKMNLPR
jgi:hypothetical protein